MLHFRKLSIADKAWAEPFIRAEDSRSADYNFGNIYMWDGAFRQHLASVDGRLLTKLRYEDMPFFAFPIGSGDLKPAIDALTEFAAHRGYPLAIRGVTEEHRALLESAYPGRFCFAEDRDCFDYIYSIEKLSTFSGKKLHGKRNFCNRFEKEHSWEFRRLTPELMPWCMGMLGAWQGSYEAPPEGLDDEHAAIVRGFMRWRELGLEGGVLFADGKIAGFTVGEVISSDTFDVHFEKAFASMPGAYPMVCREFSRQIMADHPEIVYLNREDDMGHENLRSAKQEYYPEFLLTKYTAREKKDV
jgi:hypothetical protein